jgi:hypothetical protein
MHASHKIERASDYSTDRSFHESRVNLPVFKTACPALTTCSSFETFNSYETLGLIVVIYW